MDLFWQGPRMIGHTEGGFKVFWHSTPLSRLRFISFVAEVFWSLAFKKRKGLNQLGGSSVPSVVLSNVKVNGHTYVRRKCTVAQVDSDIAYTIAVEVVRKLEQKCSCRVLDAIVPVFSKGKRLGEHDLIVERPGQSKPSSVEVKCRTILKPKVLLPTCRKQIRRDSLKLYFPAQFAERIVVLMEFGTHRLEDGWKTVRIERLDPSGWKPLVAWPGCEEAPITTNAGAAISRTASSSCHATGGVKRRRTSAAAERSSDRFVFVGGERYTSLPKYLGRDPVKSEKNLALACCADDRIELRRGDWQSLSGHWGKELLEKGCEAKFLSCAWVDSCVMNPRPEKPSLQLKLLKPNQQPGSHKYLWRWSHLESGLK